MEKALADAKKEMQETVTGNTAESIADSIKEGFGNGLRSVRDFAGTAQDIIRKAMLSALEINALEKPIKDLFEKFAADAESGGALDKEEVEDFKNNFNQIITNATKFADEIEKATGVKLAGLEGTLSNNTLTGAIKGITEQQADLLAGQFGGQRVATLQLLDVQRTAQANLNQIQNNTANTVIELRALVAYMRDVTTGNKAIKIQ